METVLVSLMNKGCAISVESLMRVSQFKIQLSVIRFNVFILFHIKGIGCIDS